MSHFVILVVGSDVEEQLAPYQENNMEDCPKEFLEFHDVEDEYISQYQTETTKAIKLSDGSLVSKYDPMFRVEVPPSHEKVEVPVKELYPTYKAYMEDYCGYVKDPETGRYGYWENPNAKWDYYEVGGRWAGSLLLKKEAAEKIKNGNPEGYCVPNFSWGWSPEDKAKALKEPRVDIARKRDVDVEGMERPLREAAEKQWDEWHGGIKGLNPGDQKQKEWVKENFGFMVTKKTIEQLDSMEKEEYVSCRSIWSPYALVWNKKWYSKGEMGWFAMSFNEENNWNGQFKELWSEIPDDELVTMVDCHI